MNVAAGGGGGGWAAVIHSGVSVAYFRGTFPLSLTNGATVRSPAATERFNGSAGGERAEHGRLTGFTAGFQFEFSKSQNEVSQGRGFLPVACGTSTCIYIYVYLNSEYHCAMNTASKYIVSGPHWYTQHGSLPGQESRHLGGNELAWLRLSTYFRSISFPYSTPSGIA